MTALAAPSIASFTDFAEMATVVLSSAEVKALSLQMASRLKMRLLVAGYALAEREVLVRVMPPPSSPWPSADAGTSVLSTFEVLDPLTGVGFELRLELRLAQSFVSPDTFLAGAVFAYEVGGRDFPVAVGRATVRSWPKQEVNSAMYRELCQGCAAGAEETNGGELELTARLLAGLSVVMMP